MRLLLAVPAILLAMSAVPANAQAARTSFTADFGFVSATGNTRLATLNFNEKVTHTIRAWMVTQTAGYVYGKTNGVESANQLRGALRGDRTFMRNVAVFAGASYERNTFAGFDRRTDETLGLAWKALNAARDTLVIDAGGVLTQQKFVDNTTDSYPAGRLAGAYKHSFGGKSYFTQLAEYLPNFESTGEYRLNTESAVVAPISSHIGVKVTYGVRLDTNPPVGFGKTDRVLTSGLQITY